MGTGPSRAAGFAESWNSGIGRGAVAGDICTAVCGLRAAAHGSALAAAAGPWFKEALWRPARVGDGKAHACCHETAGVAISVVAAAETAVFCRVRLETREHTGMGDGDTVPAALVLLGAQAPPPARPAGGERTNTAW